MLGSMLIRGAEPGDWPAIWPFMRDIAAAGETFSWDRDIREQDAREYWLRPFPGRAVVALGPDGTILGTPESRPNHGGAAAPAARAGVMVDPAPLRPRRRACPRRARHRPGAGGRLPRDAVQRRGGEQRAGRLALALTRIRGTGDRAAGLLPSGRRLRRPAHHVPQAVSAQPHRAPLSRPADRAAPSQPWAAWPHSTAGPQSLRVMSACCSRRSARSTAISRKNLAVLPSSSTATEVSPSPLVNAPGWQWPAHAATTLSRRISSPVSTVLDTGSAAGQLPAPSFSSEMSDSRTCASGEPAAGGTATTSYW